MLSPPALLGLRAPAGLLILVLINRVVPPVVLLAPSIKNLSISMFFLISKFYLNKLVLKFVTNQNYAVLSNKLWH